MVAGVFVEGNADTSDSILKMHHLSNGYQGVGQRISHSSLGKRDANPKPLSILDVLFQDNSDLSLLLGNNGALGAENVDTFPQKSDTRDKDTLDKKKIKDVDKFWDMDKKKKDIWSYDKIHKDNNS